jgi:endonuclease/exonuclease/phosphatase family metal-dependent hydrolase
MRRGFILSLITFYSVCVFAQLAKADGLRIVAANLSSGNQQNYDAGDGRRILSGLKPDVVLIQEFRYKENTPENFRELVDESFGPEYSYFRESIEGDTTGAIPNGVISRFPILSAGEWEDPIPGNRDFAWARLDLPGDRELFAISVHLKASNDAASREKRVQEARSLIALIREQVSPDDYVVLGGDLNTRARTEQAIEVLAELLSEQRPPRTLNRDESMTGTSMNGRYAYDWVLANRALQQLETPVKFFSAEDSINAALSFESGLIFDSTLFEPLALVPGVRREDSRAPGMQHLAVVKDFELPCEGN